MKKIQKLMAIALCIAMFAGLCACAKTPAPADTTADNTASTTQPSTDGAKDEPIVNPDAVSTKDTLAVVLNDDIGNFGPAGATSFTHVQAVH